MAKISMGKMKKYGKLAGKIVSILSIVFIIWAIYKLGFDFDSITNWPIFLAVATVSVIAKTVTVYLTGFAWTSWLQFFAGRKIDTREAVCVYAKANIGKYLPGNVMHYLERNMFATGLGISQKKLAASTLIEVAGLVSVAFLMAVLVSASQLAEALQQIFGDGYLKIVVLAGVVVLLVMIGILAFFRRKLSEVLKDYTWGSFAKTLIKALFLYMTVLVVLGLIMVVLYMYMGGKVDFHNGSLIVSGYIIAWVLGFVVPGASGGIGVRELVITVLLGPVVGTELVLTLSVIHRLITVIGDFLAYLVMLIIRRKKA